MAPLHASNEILLLSHPAWDTHNQLTIFVVGERVEALTKESFVVVVDVVFKVSLITMKLFAFCILYAFKTQLF